jgi:hypothetical protein
MSRFSCCSTAANCFLAQQPEAAIMYATEISPANSAAAKGEKGAWWVRALEHIYASRAALILSGEEIYECFSSASGQLLGDGGDFFRGMEEGWLHQRVLKKCSALPPLEGEAPAQEGEGVGILATLMGLLSLGPAPPAPEARQVLWLHPGRASALVASLQAALARAQPQGSEGICALLYDAPEASTALMPAGVAERALSLAELCGAPAAAGSPQLPVGGAALERLVRHCRQLRLARVAPQSLGSMALRVLVIAKCSAAANGHAPDLEGQCAQAACASLLVALQVARYAKQLQDLERSQSKWEERCRAGLLAGQAKEILRPLAGLVLRIKQQRESLTQFLASLEKMRLDVAQAEANQSQFAALQKASQALEYAQREAPSVEDIEGLNQKLGEHNARAAELRDAFDSLHAAANPNQGQNEEELEAQLQKMMEEMRQQGQQGQPPLPASPFQGLQGGGGAHAPPPYPALPTSPFSSPQLQRQHGPAAAPPSASQPVAAQQSAPPPYSA